MTDAQLREALTRLQLAWEAHDEEGKVGLSMDDAYVIHSALSDEWKRRGYSLLDGRPQ